MEGKTMTKAMLALTNALSVARRSPSPTNALLLDDIEVGSFWWLTHAGISCFLVLFAGIMSGLTLGLMSLGLVDLEILQRSGTSQEKKEAAAILPVVKKQHQLLVTLLLCNACAMEALPICLDKIFHPFVAVILSVTFVLAFGEVIPQAICTRYGLAVGANFVWLVRILMIVCYPIAYPVGKCSLLSVGGKVKDDHISLLINAGLLARQLIDSNIYWFAIPNIGSIIKGLSQVISYSRSCTRLKMMFEYFINLLSGKYSTAGCPTSR